MAADVGALAEESGALLAAGAAAAFVLLLALVGDVALPLLFAGVDDLLAVLAGVPVAVLPVDSGFAFEFGALEAGVAGAGAAEVAAGFSAGLEVDTG